MQQRRTGTPAQYQQVNQNDNQQIDIEMNKAHTVSVYKSTFTEDVVSRASYIRVVDLLTLFSELLKIGSDNTPAGTGGNVVTGIYKLASQVALPIWKAGNEMHNHGRLNTKITIAHVLNVIDALSSTISFGLWCIGTAYDDKDWIAASKYFLAFALVMHVVKDAIQKYQASQTQTAEKKALEHRLDFFEREQTKLFNNDKILQDNTISLQEKVKTVEGKMQSAEERIASLTSQRR